MNKYKHILVATDFSALAEQAIKQADGFANLLSAKLTVLHVVEHFPEDMPEDMIPPEDVDPETFVYEKNHARLEKLRDKLGRTDITIKVLLSSRSADREISDFAAQQGIDFIVLGAHGLTSSKVSHAAKADVLLVNHSKNSTF